MEDCELSNVGVYAIKAHFEYLYYIFCFGQAHEMNWMAQHMVKIDCEGIFWTQGAVY